MLKRQGPRVPWVALGGVAAGFLGWLGAQASLAGLLRLPACPTRTFFGISCASCGATRCVLALARGRLGEAFHWHPVLVLLLALAPLAMLWDLDRAFRGRPYPALPEGPAPRAAAALLLLATWLIQALRGI